MNLKNYQQQTLKTLSKFLSQAKILGIQEAFKLNRNAPSYSAEYFKLPKLEGVPYVCLRLPTGGGKTLLASYSIKLAAENFLERDFPVVLWLVPTDIIRQQTLKLLRDTKSFYRQVLDDAFKMQVKIFDVTEFRTLRLQDLFQSLNIFVATFQSFRVTNTEGRKVYQSNEFLEPCFRDIPQQNYFQVSENGGYKSFGNLLAYLRSLMIIDEAHNYSSELSLDTTQKLRPSAIIELTATPAQNSNVLFQVSASELKAEEMIKLPIELTENQSWEMTIDNAVQKRNELENLANLEREYIRPIALFQAESRNKEITVDIVKKYLIEGAKVPENEIAIATGDRRELDGVNLFSRDCSIRYIITVQALKEGWDCPFAYVFCSLAKVHSPKDAEQLLGRVLRMPFAKKRTSSELNRAYAFVAVKDWATAAENIHDNLLNMGFEDAEARAALGIQQKLLDATRTIKFQVNELPRMETTNLFLQSQTTVEETSDGYEVTISDISDEHLKELADHVNRIFRKKENREKFLQELQKNNFQPAKKNSPSSQGVKFEIPLLCLDFGDGAEVADVEDFLPENWKLTGNYDTDLPNFRNNLEEHCYEFDIFNHKVKSKYLAESDKNFFGGVTNWTFSELVGWFTDKIIAPDINFEDLAEYIRKILERQSAEKNISLAELVRLRFALLKTLSEKIKTCRSDAYKKGWQDKLFACDNIACVKPDITKNFVADYYPAKKFYQGHIIFEKHFYNLIGKMNAEEVDCAVLIDRNKKVETWIRNIELEPLFSFWLPTHSDKFYPDFIVKLKDGTYAAIEYKGEPFVTNDDSKEKNLLGELWASKSNGFCKFLMATKIDDKGRNLDTQLKDFL